MMIIYMTGISLIRMYDIDICNKNKYNQNMYDMNIHNKVTCDKNIDDHNKS